MSKDADTAPAAETEIAETTSLTDILDPRDAHERTPEHEAEVEVGDPKPERAASPPPPPAAAAPAAAPAAEAKIDPALKPEDDPKNPYWFRQQVKRERLAREAAEARATAAERRTAAPQERRPDTEDDDMNRPMTRAEMIEFHDTQRHIARVEASAESFVEKHGAELFDEVHEWLISKRVNNDPRNNPMETWALSQRNPWAAAYTQYQREKIADEIGDDPAAYRAKLEADIRAEMEAAKLSEETDQHTPAARPSMQPRPKPPAPASTVRSAVPDRERSGKFAGPTPLSAIVNR